MTKYYPFQNGAAYFNRRMGRFFDRDDPLWLVSEAFGPYPALELNLSARYQRKIFYFPKAYGAPYLRCPLYQLIGRLTPGSVFLDIGANLGIFSLLAARVVGPTGRVIAFEPDPMTFQSLHRSAQLAGLSQIEPVQMALSDRTTDLPLHMAQDGTANSLLPEAPGRENRYVGVRTVPVTSLDELSTRMDLDLDRVGLLKIDVEGEEVRTVAGMLKSLAHAAFPPIWCEVRGPKGSTRAPGTFDPVLRLLTPLGYRPYRWDGAGQPVGVDEVRGREDILFRRSA